jgi:chlorite dismutase
MIYVNFIAGALPALPPDARVHRYTVSAGAAGFETGATVHRVESGTLLDAGLRGVVQHLHYTTLEERADLTARSRAELPPSPQTTAVLIPIRKSAEWWQLAQDQRGAHFHSAHTPVGAPYVETIFRKLYHSRYLGTPYDFLTYFEFPVDEADTFRALLAALRATPEWAYVEEEHEVWMTKLT